MEPYKENKSEIILPLISSVEKFYIIFATKELKKKLLTAYQVKFLFSDQTEWN